MYLSNKYTRIYYRIINNAQLLNRKKDIGIEKHHIIPKSIGGTDGKVNLVNLTCREHFICHWLLTKMTSGDNYECMIYALRMMRVGHKASRYDTIISGKVYAKLKILYSAIHSKKMAELSKGRAGPMCGRKHTVESKMKMSQPGKLNGMYGNIRPVEWRTAHSKFMSRHNPMKGKTGILAPGYGKPCPHAGKSNIELHGKEKACTIKEKQSISAKNKPKITCPHCNLTGATGNMKRWHFDNCKVNPHE